MTAYQFIHQFYPKKEKFDAGSRWLKKKESLTRPGFIFHKPTYFLYPVIVIFFSTVKLTDGSLLMYVDFQGAQRFVKLCHKTEDQDGDITQDAVQPS